jgi:hypothetical protein
MPDDGVLGLVALIGVSLLVFVAFKLGCLRTQAQAYRVVLEVYAEGDRTESVSLFYMTVLKALDDVWR